LARKPAPRKRVRAVEHQALRCLSAQSLNADKRVDNPEA
jgi:hypothetical protein